MRKINALYDGVADGEQDLSSGAVWFAAPVLRNLVSCNSDHVFNCPGIVEGQL